MGEANNIGARNTNYQRWKIKSTSFTKRAIPRYNSKNTLIVTSINKQTNLTKKMCPINEEEKRKMEHKPYVHASCWQHYICKL